MEKADHGSSLSVTHRGGVGLAPFVPSAPPGQVGVNTFLKLMPRFACFHEEREKKLTVAKKKKSPLHQATGSGSWYTEEFQLHL